MAGNTRVQAQRQAPLQRTDGPERSQGAATVLLDVPALQRRIGNRAITQAIGGSESVPPLVQQALRGSGHPLDPDTRAFMESRFQHDFSQVRLHTDHQAAESAAGVLARAFTIGADVVFGAGRYRPDTVEGKRLLAHELSHVVQQSRGGARPSPSPHSHLELSAQLSADAVMSGAQSVVVNGASAPGISREPTNPSEVKVEPIPLTEVQTGPGQSEVRFADEVLFTVQRPLGKEGDDRPILAINAAAVGEAGQRTYRVAVMRTSDVNIRLQPNTVQTLRQRGYDVAVADAGFIHRPGELGERPILLGGQLPRLKPPPPPAKRPPAPKTPPAATRQGKPPVKNDQPPAANPQATPAIKTPTDQKTEPPSLLALTPGDLIDSHTSYLNLDEEALGADLVERAKRGNYSYVQQVLDTLGSTDRDDVALAFMEKADEETLNAFAQSPEGRLMLDRLFDELTEGELGADENAQAQRILKVKTTTALTPEQFQQKQEHAMILPHRKPGMTVISPSPIFAHRVGNGKIHVRLSSNIWSGDYVEDARRLPTQIMVDGIDLDENDIVGVKDYDRGGQVDYYPSLYLVQISNQDTTTALHKAGEAFGIGLTLGFGGGVAAGAEGGTEVAAAGTLARIGAVARTGIIWADRAAFAVDIVNTIVQEHRDLVVSVMGAKFVDGLDKVASYARLYGLARGGVGLAQIANNLRKAFQNWRAIAREAQKDLSGSDLKTIQQVDKETENLLNKLDEAEAAQKSAGTGTSADADVSSHVPGKRADVIPIDRARKAQPPPNQPQQNNQVLESDVELAQQQPQKVAVGDPVSENATQAVKRGGGNRNNPPPPNPPPATKTTVSRSTNAPPQTPRGGGGGGGGNRVAGSSRDDIYDVMADEIRRGDPEAVEASRLATDAPAKLSTQQLIQRFRSRIGDVERHHSFFSYLLRAINKARGVRGVPRHGRLVSLDATAHAAVHDLFDALHPSLARRLDASNEIGLAIQRGEITPTGIGDLLEQFYRDVASESPEVLSATDLAQIERVIASIRRRAGF